MTICESVDFFICLYLIGVIFLRWMTPLSEHMSVKAHSGLISLFLAAAADVVDFIEYSSTEKIVDFTGINLIYGKF